MINLLGFDEDDFHIDDGMGANVEQIKEDMRSRDARRKARSNIKKKIDLLSEMSISDILDDIVKTTSNEMAHELVNIVGSDPSIPEKNDDYPKWIILYMVMLGIKVDNVKFVKQLMDDLIAGLFDVKDPPKFYDNLAKDLINKYPRFIFPYLPEKGLIEIKLTIPDFELYDAIEMETKTSGSYLNENKAENIIISTLNANETFNTESAIDFTRKELAELIDNYFYSCAKNQSPVFTEDIVNIDHEDPFIKLARGIVYFIPASYLYLMINSKSQYFVVLNPEKKILTAHIDTIQVKPGLNYLGNQVNFVSSDHCQANSDKIVYQTVMAVNLQPSAVEKNEYGKRSRDEYNNNKNEMGIKKGGGKHKCKYCGFHKK